MARAEGISFIFFVFTGLTWIPELLAQALDSCFNGGIDEMVFCCTQHARCFGDKASLSHLSADHCCSRRAVLNLVKTFSGLISLPNTTAEILETISSVARLLVLHVDPGCVEAWDLLVYTTGKLAVAKFDDLVDRGIEAALLENSGIAALTASRALNYAAQLCEQLFQAMIFDKARVTGRAAVQITPGEVLPQFSGALRLYRIVQDALDTLSYFPAGINSKHSSVLRFKRNEEVVLVVAVVGAWANVASVTLWSVLRHRSSRLRVFILGDMIGIRDFRRVIKTFRQRIPGMIDAVRFDYIDVFLHPRMLAYRRRLPFGCANSNMSVALFARLICHELLPADVKRAIAIDLGDILVFSDILELWREGDLLEPDQLFAAASHRAHEEAWRHAKPSMLNGGVVLYEVSRMRLANYTEETIRAAQFGLEQQYDHFCAWDQDILNVLHTDIWQKARVRILPCEWSLFPVTSWQFFWNSPERWIPELFEFRRYPGLLAAGHIEHFCPDETLLMATMFAFPEEGFHRNLAHDNALHTGARHRKPGAAIIGADGLPCACGGRASLLHVPSTMKLWPWSHRLFEHHTAPFLAAAESGSNINSRKEYSPGKSGGFWGAETRKDLQEMEGVSLMYAKGHGGVVSIGRCATLHSSRSHYARVDFLPWERGHDLAIYAETTASSDAYVFIGDLSHDNTVGWEFALDIGGRGESAVRWGVEGHTLSSYSGLVLNGSADEEQQTWSSFWLHVDGTGVATCGLGTEVGAANSGILHASHDAFTRERLEFAAVYVGTKETRSDFWYVCHQ